jgi:succinoglycan biosynthesis protein ExoA
VHDPVSGEVPVISVVVPCRNEEQYIAACATSILAQDCFEEYEVIVVDGMSEDGTREILAHLAETEPRLRLLDNPLRTPPAALNIGIRASRGCYIGILGAHATYSPSYLQTCFTLLQEHPEACCAGGPIVSVGRGRFGQAVAIAMSHPVGVGNAKHRFADYEGYAEGACFPMFRGQVFDKVGLFDESLIFTEDDELNYRLAQHGERIYISPRARCVYFVRETPAKLFRQYFNYGYWRVAVLERHGLPASVRQIVPPVFMAGALALAAVGLSLPGWWKLVSGLLPTVYGTTLLFVGATGVGKAGWQVALLFPVAAAIMHAAYALGFVSALIRGTKRVIQSFPVLK